MKPLPRETKLAQYYQAELEALRNEAQVFAHQHPQLATALSLSGGRSPDPQVELLLQSFAFMSGRLRHQVEVDKARLPNALAAALYPHLAAPVPCMVVAQAGNVAVKGQLLRQQGMSATAYGANGVSLDCRFRLCYDTPLLPLQVERVELQRPNPARDGSAGSVLALGLAPSPQAKPGPLGQQETLRFYLDTDNEPAAFRLYELLALHGPGCRVASTLGEAACAGASLRWLGYDEDCAILPASAASPPGYRLLQEYFAFPQKFLFFEVGPLDLSQLRGGCELRLLLDAPYEPHPDYARRTVQLNCMPLVNLFPHPIEPLALDHSEFEYRLSADLQQHSNYEIYAMERLYSVRAQGSLRTIEPYYGLDDLESKPAVDYYYLARRERSEASNVAGSEYYVSFLDRRLQLSELADETIGGSALCTNRRLPEQLRPGSALLLEGAGPNVTLSTLAKPSGHEMPPQIGARPWALVSQLMLNRLSLASGAQALPALKQILRLHAGQQRSVALRQIDGIQSLRTSNLMRHYAAPGWRGFLPALRVDIELDRHSFPDASPVLFWQVLRHFFALYANVNSVIETGFTTNDCSGDDSSWPQLNGDLWAL